MRHSRIRGNSAKMEKTMLFLISLPVAVCIAWLTAGALKKHPAPFYLTAAVLSITAVLAAQLHPSLPAWVTEYLLHPLTKGTLATAFWAVVMWLGALPKSWNAPLRRLIPVRGQLSIFAAILTLGHAVGFGISYLPRWLSRADWFNFTVCVLLVAIMLPLTVLSVKKIRAKMKGKSWKRIQRLAYIFYVFIPVHVFALNFARAKNGREGAFLNLMVYAVVFGGWAVCRLLKWYVTAKKPVRRAMPNTAAAALFAVLIAGTGFAARADKLPEEDVPERSITLEESTADSAPEQTDPSAETTTLTAETTPPATDQTAQTTSAADSTDETASQTAVTEETAQPEPDASVTVAAGTAESAAGTTVTTTAAATTVTTTTSATTTTTTTTAAPALKYKNGSYEVSAMGYDGMIYMTITIENDRITDITGYTDEEDDSYFRDAKKRMIPAILEAQSSGVDGVSGATFSSEAIRKCVDKAFALAAN